MQIYLIFIVYCPKVFCHPMEMVKADRIFISAFIEQLNLPKIGIYFGIMSSVYNFFCTISKQHIPSLFRLYGGYP